VTHIVEKIILQKFLLFFVQLSHQISNFQFFLICIFRNQHHIVVTNKFTPVVDCPLPGARDGALFWLIFQMTKEGIYFSDTPLGKSGLSPIYSSQLGLTCYSAEVLQNKDLVRPYQDEIEEDGTLKLLGTCDVFLCRRLHYHNIPIVADMDVRINHLVPVDLGLLYNTFEHFTKNLGGRMDPEYCLPSGIYLDITRTNIVMPVCDEYKKYQETMVVPSHARLTDKEIENNAVPGVHTKNLREHLSKQRTSGTPSSIPHLSEEQGCGVDRPFANGTNGTMARDCIV